MEPVSPDENLSTIDCGEILLRSISSDYWIKKGTGEIRPAAFRLRDADKKGLSVDIASKRSVALCVHQPRTRNCYAVGSLHAGRVKDLGLNINPDSQQEDHAYITSVSPSESSDENKLREDRAEQLADICRAVWYALETRDLCKLKNLI